MEDTSVNVPELKLNPFKAALFAVALLGASQPLPVRLDDDLNAVYGAHPGARAAHAKGVVLLGTFTPSPSAASITKATFLQRTSPVSVTIRFSNGSGVPTVNDNDPSATPHGIAIKYHLPGGTDMDTLAQSVDFFPARTGEEFATFLSAVAASGQSAKKPTALDRYLLSHPAAKAFLSFRTPPPVSFGTLTYFGINAFKFTDNKGAVRYGRYLFRPLAGAHFLPASAGAMLAPNYLVDEIVQRVKKGPVAFDFYVQIAGKGDDIANPTIPWPLTRQLVKLGTLTVRSSVPDSLAAQKTLLFLPTSVPDGIAPADPMIGVRTSEYGVSFGRRSSAR
jgi:catalase